jgi:hypothetical protein
LQRERGEGRQGEGGGRKVMQNMGINYRSWFPNQNGDITEAQFYVHSGILLLVLMTIFIPEKQNYK